MGWSFDEYSTRRRGDAEGRRKNLHAETRRSRRKDIFERNTKKIPLSAFSASPREPLFPAPGRDQPGPAGEEFLHHGLFEQAGLFPPLLQSRQFRVHVGQDLGDGGLFSFGREAKAKRIHVFIGNLIDGCTDVVPDLALYRITLKGMKDESPVLAAINSHECTKSGTSGRGVYYGTLSNQ